MHIIVIKNYFYISAISTIWLVRLCWGFVCTRFASVNVRLGHMTDLRYFVSLVYKEAAGSAIQNVRSPAPERGQSFSPLLLFLTLPLHLQPPKSDRFQSRRRIAFLLAIIFISEILLRRLKRILCEAHF